MGRLKARPSPALIVAVLALIACAAGVALAGPASNSAVTKKKVKKIADKEIEKLAPGLSVANAATLEGKPASAFASAAIEAPHLVGAPGEPPFENGWSNYGAGASPASFFKDSFGIVHLGGTVGVTPDASRAFTLPPGYRPQLGVTMPLGWPNGGSTFVGDDGRVVIDCGGTATCSPAGLDGLTFRP